MTETSGTRLAARTRPTGRIASLRKPGYIVPPKHQASGHRMHRTQSTEKNHLPGFVVFRVASTMTSATQGLSPPQSRFRSSAAPRAAARTRNIGIRSSASCSISLTSLRRPRGRARITNSPGRPLCPERARVRLFARQHHGPALRPTRMAPNQPPQLTSCVQAGERALRPREDHSALSSRGVH